VRVLIADPELWNIKVCFAPKMGVRNNAIIRQALELEETPYQIYSPTR
jgi:hypothetical protein